MSRAGKPKGKKGKGQTADREEETRFIEDGADTGQKTGHGKSPGATAVSRGGGDGPVETSSNADREASGEGDPLKKRKKSFGRRMMSYGRSSSSSPKPSSKNVVHSPTSSLAAVDDTGRQSEDATVSDVAANLHDSEKVKRLEKALDGHIRLHADVMEEMRSKTDEVERGTKLQLEERLRNEQEHVSELNIQLEETRHELEKLKEEYGKLELQLRQGGDARQMKEELPELEILDQMRALEEKLQSRDEELRLLRQQATGSAVPSQASLKYDDLPPGTDPKVEIATLKHALENKDQKIQSLQIQVVSFERVIQEQQKLHCHTKEQSKQVLKLRQELEAVKKEKETLLGGKTPSQGKMEDQTGVDLRLQIQQLKEKLTIAKDEKRKLEEERDSAKSQVDLLHADLGVTQVESTKEEKEWETERVTLRLQLETLRSDNDNLQQQMGRLETDLNITEAKCAKLDGGMIQLQTVLSESELDRHKIHQELVKVKHQRDQHEQMYLSLLSVHESQASQVECVQREISQVQREASQWREKLSGQNTALSKLKDEVEPLRRQNKDLRGEVEALRKENEDLKGEIEARIFAADVWKEDFQKERDDRQQAAGRVDNERAEISVQYQHLHNEVQTCHTRIHQFESENKRLRDEIRVHQQVMTDYDAMQLQLVQHKEQVASMEQLFQTQQQEHKAQLEQANQLQRTQFEGVHRQLKQANQQLDQAVTDNEKLNDDVLAKMQQVKQYKKQVDGLKTEVENYKSEVTSNQEVDAEKTQQITNLRRQFQESVARQHHQEVASQQLRGEIQRLNNQLQVQSSGRASQSDELAPYNVPYFSVVPGEEKGSGSYGSVHLIEVNGVPCIAKQLHDILVGRNREEAVGSQQRDAIQRKFRNECVLLSRLKHPNIVQFMGIHYDYRDPSNLTLIMECLPMDLEKCLKHYPNLPLSTIISILLDVSYGLLHLHSQTPPIIHRDLTAANILLTCDMKAKLADLGVSKILELNPLLASAQSALPGTLAYMPPETLAEEPQYDTKLDVFSFGVVALYAAIKEFPLVHEKFSVAAFQNKELQIHKRGVWIRKMGVDHCLHQLVIQCLKDDPAERPSTHNVNAMLKQLSHQYPKRFQNVLQMCSQIESLEQQVSASHQQLTELWAQTVQLQREREELLRRGMEQNVQQIHPIQQGANVQSPPIAVNTRYYRGPTVQPAAGPAQPQYGLQPSYPVPRPRHNRSPYPPQQ